MADPIRFLTEWPGDRGKRTALPAGVTRVVRQDPRQQSAQLIARHELRVWFEPRWQDARYLAARFPYCLVCSIPLESSDAFNPRRIPGWRPRRNLGVV